MNIDRISRKRLRNSTNDENNDGKRSRICQQFYTNFENLSNDILYEIFEYLDFYYLYSTFLNFNQRFYNLIYYPQLSVKIDTSSIPNEIFLRYFTDIIEPNIHRVESISIINHFDINLTKFIQLKILVLNEMPIEYLNNLRYLNSLPRLSVLFMSNNHYDEDKSYVFNQIFDLPVLKYCQISLKQYKKIVISERSNSIEQLVMNSSINLDLICDILLNVPQLRRLSIDHLFGSRYSQDSLILFPLNQLTNVSLRNCSISFENFALLAKKCFSHVEVLRINTNAIRVYLDGNQWEYLISSYMSKLRIFDFQHRYRLGYFLNNTIKTDYQNLIHKFNSSFWIDRQWRFDTEEICVNGCYFYIFYSKTSNKEKQKLLFEETKTKINIDLFLQSWL